MSPDVKTQFSLRALVCRVLDDSDSVNLYALTQRIIAQLTDEDEFIAALSQALPGYVRQVIATRPGGSPDEFDAIVANASLAPTAPTTTRTTPPTRSRKVEALRAYGAGLREQLRVGESITSLKLVADCGVADLRFVIKTWEQEAREAKNQAAFWQSIVERMLRHDASHVRDLPPAVLKQFFGSET